MLSINPRQQLVNNDPDYLPARSASGAEPSGFLEQTVQDAGIRKKPSGKLWTNGKSLPVNDDFR